MWEDGNPATLRKHRGFAAATASLPVLFIPFFFLGGLCLPGNVIFRHGG